MDAPIRGDHDHTDTNPSDRRQDTALAYAPGSGDRTGEAVAGSRFGGRLGDGEDARLSWLLSTLDPAPATIGPSPPPTGTGPGPPPPRPPPPDLRITAFDLSGFTVTNSGAGPAGPFLVSAQYRGSFSFPGLAPGASITQPALQVCSDGTSYTATADSAGQVTESDETTNTFTFGPIFC
jgi:hypothetical protein